MLGSLLFTLAAVCCSGLMPLTPSTHRPLATPTKTRTSLNTHLPSHRRTKVIVFAEGDRDTKRKGKKKLRLKERQETDTQQDEELAFDSYWTVLLHNDEYHTFDFVAGLLIDTIPGLGEDRAWELTMTVHSEGVAVVTSAIKPLAEQYCGIFQQEGLTVSVSPEKNFKQDDEQV